MTARETIKEVLIVLGVILGLLLLLSIGAGCTSLRAVPKPHQGGELIATLPMVPYVPQGDPARQWQVPTNLPAVEIHAASPQNQDSPTVTSYTRRVTQDGVTEELSNSSGTSQHDKARDDWLSALRAKFQAATDRWGMVLGGILIGLGAFGLSPRGRLMIGLSKESCMILMGAGGLLLVMPSVRSVVQSNPLVLLAIAYMFLRDRKEQYKVEAALLKPPPNARIL